MEHHLARDPSRPLYTCGPRALVLEGAALGELEGSLPTPSTLGGVSAAHVASTELE